MIGNDVIDLSLAAAENNWRRSGYLQKIFTPREQDFIKNSENADLTVWKLWSRKESVYKIFNRVTGIRAYNPIRFECLDDSDLGTVSFENILYWTQTQIAGNCIHTIATSEPGDLLKVVYLENRMHILKENGIPFINQNPVSISNHGRFEKIVTLQTKS